MLVENPIGKCDQLITYAFRLLNNVEKKYTIIKREVLMMVYALRKYYHYLFDNKFFLICKPYGPPLLNKKTPSFWSYCSMDCVVFRIRFFDGV